MKSNFISLLSLSFSVLLAGACAGEAPDKGTGGSLSMLSAGEDLPEECNQCWDEFQDCFAQGNSMEECAEQIIQCVDECQAPLPPNECLHCSAGFDACAETAEANGDTAEDCAIGFEGCLSACEDNTQCADGEDCNEPPNVCNGCDDQYEQCVGEGDENNPQGSDSNEECEAQWNDCQQQCQPDDTDLCSLAEQQCQDGQGVVQTPDGQVYSCAELLQECFGGPEQPNDPECDFWMDAMEQCENGQEPGDQAEGLTCEEIGEICQNVCGD